MEKYGYDEKMFVLEENATNIYENLYLSKKIVKNINKYNNILRRIKLCASGMDYPLEKIQFVGTVNTKKRNFGKDN